jgi:hypothetical protein
LFRPEDVTQVDVHEYVRRNQQRYFRGGVYHPVEAAMAIAAEALLSGASDVRIRSKDGWISIYADVDWLAGSEEVVFRQMRPFPAGGPNGITTEIFPVIFARSVATSTESEVSIIKGDTAGPLEDSRHDHGRAVAFEVATSEHVEPGG